MYEPETGRYYWSKTASPSCLEGYGPYYGWNFYKKEDKTAQRPGRLGATAAEVLDRPDHGTEYPGVTKDNIVSYLKLNSVDSAELNLLKSEGI
jgi:hypothetical protein